jgi:hypothetical protein
MGESMVLTKRSSIPAPADILTDFAKFLDCTPADTASSHKRRAILAENAHPS